MAKKKLLPKVKLWEWIVSLGVTTFAGVIIWTNETLDLLIKLGWKNINTGQATLIFMLIMSFGLGWILTNILRHKKLI